MPGTALRALGGRVDEALPLPLAEPLPAAASPQALPLILRRARSAFALR